MLAATTTIIAAPASARSAGKYIFKNAIGESVTVIALNEEHARRGLLRLVRNADCWWLARHDALIPPSLRAPVTGFGHCEPCGVTYLEQPENGCCDWCGSGLRAL